MYVKEFVGVCVSVENWHGGCSYALLPLLIGLDACLLAGRDERDGFADDITTTSSSG